MSFDNGQADDMTSDESFESKYAALLDEHNMSLAQLCDEAGVRYAVGYEAICRGSHGLPATMEIHQRMLAVFGVDVSYLLCVPGARPAASSEQRIASTEERRAVRTLIWDFNIRNNIPQRHRRPFVQYVLALLEAKPTKSTMRMAARAAVPRSVLDAGYLYQRLLREGFFDKA